MPFQFTKKDRERWQASTSAAVANATTALRKQMVTAIGDGGLPSAADAYDSDWWDSAMEEHVYEPFHAVALDAATTFAQGTELEIPDDRLTDLAVGVAALAVAFISSRSEVVEKRVSELVERGSEDGWDAPKLAAGLGLTDPDEQEPGPLSDKVSGTIGVGASTSLTESAANAVVEEVGAQGLKTWNCIFRNSRDSHMEADGQTVAVDEFFTVGDSQGRYPGDPDLPVEEVVNCVVEGTTVTADTIEIAFRRRYVGPVLRLRTRSGQDLTVTPNHPLLTQRGWVVAGGLDPGRDRLYRLIRQDIDVAPLGSDPDPDGQPIEQVFMTAATHGTAQRMVGLPVDFHGDGTDADVEVAAPVRLLGTDDMAELSESHRQLMLVDSDEILDVLAADGPALQLDEARRRSTASCVRGSDHGGVALLARPLRVASAAEDDTGRAKSLGNGLTSRTGGASEGLHRLAAGVALDEVVDVEVIAYDGHVFNLSTGTGWYLANGIVTHNCQCYLSYTVVAPAATDAGEVSVDDEAVAASGAAFGGPGSGPRPGYKRPKNPDANPRPDASPSTVPLTAPVDAVESQGTSFRLSAGTAAALDRSTDQWCSMIGFTADEIDADWRAETGGPREQLKIRAGAAVAARMAQDPEWIAGQAENTVQHDPVHVADAYIQQWASTAADGSAESHAIQRAAAEVLGTPPDVGASSTHGLSRDEIDGIYESDGWAMRAFVRSVYAETQSTLKAEGITEMTLARGMTVRENNNAPPDTGEIAMNPLSSWATSLHAAQEFTGGNGRFFVANVPAERIVAIPATGPGCASEYEVIVMGGPAAAVSLPAYSTIVPSRAEAASTVPGVVWVDEPPNDDWPKRTDDLIDVKSIRASASVEGRAIAALRALATGVYGGPGSGPRPGQKRAKKVAADRPEGKSGSFTLEGAVPEADRAAIEATMTDLTARFPIGHVRIRFESGDDAITSYANSQSGDPLVPSSPDRAAQPNPELGGSQIIHINADNWEKLSTAEGYTAQVRADEAAQGLEPIKGSTYGNREEEMRPFLVDSSHVGTITHEYGHMVEHAMTRAGASQDEIHLVTQPYVEGAMSDVPTPGGYVMHDSPSVYGTENAAEQAAELFAAYVAGHQARGEPFDPESKMAERVARYGALVEQYVGKKP